MDALKIIDENADWFMKLESLDRREAELHETQLRLLRQQIGALLGEHSTLQQEVDDLRAGHNDLEAQVAPKFQGMQAAHIALHARVAQLHASMKGMEDSQIALRGRVIDLERRGTGEVIGKPQDSVSSSVSCTPIGGAWSAVREELIEQMRLMHADVPSTCDLNTLRQEIAAEIQNVKMMAPKEDALEALRQEVMKKVEGLQSIMPLNVTLDSLRDDFETKVRDMQMSLQLDLGELREAWSLQLGDIQHHFEAHKASLEELQRNGEEIHKLLDDQANCLKQNRDEQKHTLADVQADMVGVKASMEDLQAKSHGLQQNLNKHDDSIQRVKTELGSHFAEVKANADSQASAIREQVQVLQAKSHGLQQNLQEHAESILRINTDVCCHFAEVKANADTQTSDLRKQLDVLQCKCQKMQEHVADTFARVQSVENGCNLSEAKTHADTQVSGIRERVDAFETSVECQLASIMTAFDKKLMEMQSSNPLPSDRLSKTVQMHLTPLSQRLDAVDRTLKEMPFERCHGQASLEERLETAEKFLREMLDSRETRNQMHFSLTERVNSLESVVRTKSMQAN